MKVRFPIRRDTLGEDSVAGVVLGVQSVPDGLASGLLAGQPARGPVRVHAFARLPEVAAASPEGGRPMRIDGESMLVSTFDPATIEPVENLDMRQGSLRDLRPDQVAISADYADQHGLALGDPVIVDYPDGVPVVEGEAAVQRVADRFGAPGVQINQEFTESIAGEINLYLTVVYMLLIRAIVIAVMGIANTLSLSIHERTRELGLLLAVGQTRRQTRTIVRGEALTVGLFGTVGGLGLGLFLGWALVSAMASEGFGTFAVPKLSLAVVLALGALVGVLAAVFPAHRAARMDVLSAIAME
jgi:putative ABC transport system permease protein